MKTLFGIGIILIFTPLLDNLYPDTHSKVYYILGIAAVLTSIPKRYFNK